MRLPSQHATSVAMVVKDAGGWVDFRSVSEAAGVAERTARENLKRLADEKLVECAAIRPSFLYRWLGFNGSSYSNALEKSMAIYFGDINATTKD